MFHDHSAHTSGNRIKYYKKLGECDENHQQSEPTNAKCRQVPHHSHKKSSEVTQIFSLYLNRPIKFTGTLIFVLEQIRVLDVPG